MGFHHFVVAAVAAASLSIAGAAQAQWRYYDGYRTYPPNNQDYPPFPGQEDQRSYEPQPQPPGAPDQQQGDQGPQQPGDTQQQPPSGFGFTSPNTEQQQQQQPDTGMPQPSSVPGGISGGPMDDAQAASSPRTAQVVPNPTSEGFAWKGVARVDHKGEWPRWFPPKDMLARRPDLPIEMDGGMNNPLGARALYLYEGKKDTMYRIHGTNEPDTIGKAVSSGCIRMMNGDVMDLYNRVPVGTKVVVL
jgi:lipoprotein-anchoring transpeptidase ErfK/SrfK